MHFHIYKLIVLQKVCEVLEADNIILTLQIRKNSGEVRSWRRDIMACEKQILTVTSSFQSRKVEASGSLVKMWICLTNSWSPYPCRCFMQESGKKNPFLFEEPIVKHLRKQTHPPCKKQSFLQQHSHLIAHLTEEQFKVAPVECHPIYHKPHQEIRNHLKAGLVIDRPEGTLGENIYSLHLTQYSLPHRVRHKHLCQEYNWWCRFWIQTV